MGIYMEESWNSTEVFPASHVWLPEGIDDDEQWENWGALFLYHVNLEDDRKQ